jgi:hypothetical protein
LTNLVALNTQTHRVLRISAAQAILGHSSVNVVSVIPREFPRLLAHYPIFYSKTESKQFEPAALLGFERGENLFIKDGTWDASYIPLQIQRQPFALIPRGAAATDPQATLDLAVDLDSPYVQAQDGERLFQDDGKAAPYLQNLSSMMSALVSGSREAYAFTGKLAELNLLEPVQIDIDFADRSSTKLQGLYWIAAAALKALSAAQLAELRDREYLEWMYFQMASIAHVSGLVARKNKRLSAVAPAPGTGTARNLAGAAGHTTQPP